MNDPLNQPTAPLTIEEGIKEILCNARESIRLQHKKCEDCVRESPTAAMLGAVAVGYVLHRLPVRSILITKVRILTALTPPALLFFGAAKLYDFLKNQDQPKRD